MCTEEQKRSPAGVRNRGAGKGPHPPPMGLTSWPFERKDGCTVSPQSQRVGLSVPRTHR